jgi:hypothetical protein
MSDEIIYLCFVQIRDMVNFGQKALKLESRPVIKIFNDWLNQINILYTGQHYGANREIRARASYS